MGSIGGDPVMLELFRAELDQHLPVLNEGLLALEKGRATREAIESMMRAAHSIKGAGRVMGVDPVVSVAHALEDCFTAAKDSRITLAPDAVDVLLAGVDAIQRLCSADPGDAADEAVLAALLGRITDVGTGAARSREVDVAPRSGGESPVVRVTAERRRHADADIESGTTIASHSSPAPPETEAGAIVLPRHVGGREAEWLRCQLLERLGAASSSSSSGARKLCLDFGHVERLGPEALAILLCLDPDRSASCADTIVTASGVRSSVRALFRVTGLDGVLALVD